ncbi:MAG: B12-binding domain-containing radical SAM protein [Thermodesulfobacteriota bacterium]
MRQDLPHILCVNPWIHDFAAYDVWAKPMGLLTIAAILRQSGFSVSYIDCLDRFHPREKPADPHARGGRGPYRKTRIPKPACLSDVPRHFSRYGIDAQWFREDLASAAKPDLVLVTSLMTYWYTGVRETIEVIRGIYPDVPVVLGGIYATLWPAHAKTAVGADEIVTGPAESRIFDTVARYTGVRKDPAFDLQDMDTWPYPAADLQHRIGYVPLLTATGCPYECAYCASGLLQPMRRVRSPEGVAAEIRYWHTRHGVLNFAFYDDALLVHPETHAVPMFEAIVALGLDLAFHTPNALHVRNITPKVARLMRAAGVKTVRLGVETTDFATRRMDRKISEAEFVQAAAYLREAGFGGDQVGAYLLVGLPGQDMAAVEASINAVKQSGITPILAHYTPIPGTKMWEAACAASRYDLASEPLYTNNAVMPCQPAFDWQDISRLKQRIAPGN